MGSIKHAPGKPCCGPGGSGTGSGSGDPLETNYCATHFASDWDGTELGDLLVEVDYTPNAFPGTPRPYCLQLEGIYSLPYDLARVSRGACPAFPEECILHAWKFYVDGIPAPTIATGWTYAIGISAAVVTGGDFAGANCAFQICFEALLVNPSNVLSVTGGRNEGIFRSVCYTAPTGTPVDLSAAPGPTLTSCLSGTAGRAGGAGCTSVINEHRTVITTQSPQDFCQLNGGGSPGGVFSFKGYLA